MLMQPTGDPPSRAVGPDFAVPVLDEQVAQSDKVALASAAPSGLSEVTSRGAGEGRLVRRRLAQALVH
jgi:hypothetical protein